MAERRGGDDNLFRLCECSDLVFKPEEIDAGLASDGGVGLCQQGSGDIDAADPAFELVAAANPPRSLTILSADA